MKQGFFTNLPSEMIINILSRLPVRTIISCKCVCKPWLNLLETEEFAKSHLSKSVPRLVVNDQKSCKFYEIEGVLDLEHHEDHYILLTEFGCFASAQIQGSANGLLFLSQKVMPCCECSEPEGLYIINPITEEYIQIPSPQNLINIYHPVFTHGFGSSRKTGQLKVVRIFHDADYYDTNFPNSEIQMYTLGTGLWRSITPGPELEYDSDYYGAFLNGNLHWLVFDLDGYPWISCFDLENELFSIFPSPPAVEVLARHLTCLFALEDCLCLCDSTSEDEIVIWLMKDYEVEKSWTKDFVISRSQNPIFGFADFPNAYPIKVYKDGDISMVWEGMSVFYDSRKTKTAHAIVVFESDYSMELILLTPSFLSLKSFVKEKVRSWH